MIKFLLFLILLIVLLTYRELRKQNIGFTHLRKIMADSQQVIAQALNDANAKIVTLTAQVGKIGTETAGLQSTVAALQAQIANGQEVSPELQAASDAVTASLTSLSNAVQGVDDEVPDAAPPAPAPADPAPVDPAAPAA